MHIISYFLHLEHLIPEKMSEYQLDNPEKMSEY